MLYDLRVTFCGGSRTWHYYQIERFGVGPAA